VMTERFMSRLPRCTAPYQSSAPHHINNDTSKVVVKALFRKDKQLWCIGQASRFQ
jgi:hypothetical protein